MSGGLAAISKDFEPGLIVWTFNEEDLTLTVKNNSQKVLVGLYPGTYNYSLSKEKIGLTLSVDGKIYGNYSLEKNQLIVHQNLSDGYAFTFRR